jgi:hypothetical protein
VQFTTIAREHTDALLRASCRDRHEHPPLLLPSNHHPLVVNGVGGQLDSDCQAGCQSGLFSRHGGDDSTGSGRCSYPEAAPSGGQAEVAVSVFEAVAHALRPPPGSRSEVSDRSGSERRQVGICPWVSGLGRMGLVAFRANKSFRRQESGLN